MPLKVHRIPPLPLFCLIGLVCLFGFYVLFIPGQQQQIRSLQDDYGNTLAATTAKRVLDAAFNNDLVRMQSTLEEIVSHPHLVQATIHDVENNLLVQAGEARPSEAIHTAYTAPIVLHDSISGYITITLSNIVQANKALVFWLFALALTLLALGSLLRSGAIEWQPSSTSKPSAKKDPNTLVTPTDANYEPGNEVDTIAENNTVKNSVFAVLHIKNFDVLKQQLNGETFRNTLLRFETITRDVMALYNGLDVENDGSSYTLSFLANDATNEAIFRASCSAFLIVELASIINKIPLDLAAFVSANNDDLVPANLPVAGLVLETQAAHDELIQRRLNFMEVGTEDGRMIVADFVQPFASLLENQRKQLSAPND